jgi:hypothetical protein
VPAAVEPTTQQPPWAAKAPAQTRPSTLNNQ